MWVGCWPRWQKHRQSEVCGPRLAVESLVRGWRLAVESLVRGWRLAVGGWRLRVWSAVGGCGLCCGLKMLYASCTLTSFTVHTTAHTLLNARLTAAQAERRAAAAGVGRDVKILMTNTVFTATPGFGPSLLMMASITKAELPSEGVVTVHTSYCWVTKGTY